MADRRVVWVAAVAGPAAVGAALVPLRDRLDATNAALVLLVVVVAVAALGDRWAGILAAVSAGASFDLFMTRPYGSLKISDSGDVLTTVLLLVVGIAVTELAIWGRVQHAEAVRLLGYGQGVRAAVAAVDDQAPLDVVLAQIGTQLTAILGMASCRFDYGAGVIGGGHPRLRADGQVEVDGVDCDVERFGLPLTHDLQILVAAGDRYLGRFSLQPVPGAKPTLEQRLTAVTLADRAATAITRSRVRDGD